MSLNRGCPRPEREQNQQPAFGSGSGRGSTTALAGAI
jgi:hypothetical protein